MKLLEKMTRQRCSFPFLNCVKVNKGEAMATDKDTWIFAPTKQPDGVYYGLGFGTTPTPCKEQAPEIFPDIKTDINLGDYSRFVVNAEKFEWVAKSMSKEKTRYYMNGVFFKTVDDAGLQATCGHRAHRVAMTSTAFILAEHRSMDERGFIVPRAAVEYVVAACKEQKIVQFTAYIGGDRALFAVGTYKIFTCYIDGTFPDLERVFPATDLHPPVAWDVAKMKSIINRADYVAKLQEHRKTKGYFELLKDGRARIFAKTIGINEFHETGLGELPKNIQNARLGYQTVYLKDVRKGSMITAWPKKRALGCGALRVDEGDTSMAVMPMDFDKHKL